MMKTISTANAPQAIGPYSQAKQNSGLLFISGQIPFTPAGGLAGPDIAAQTEQCAKNVLAILDAAGYSVEDVAKTSCYLVDMADFAAFNAVYERYFTGKPARACMAVKALPKGVLVEIEAIAVR